MKKKFIVIAVLSISTLIGSTFQCQATTPDNARPSTTIRQTSNANTSVISSHQRDVINSVNALFQFSRNNDHDLIQGTLLSLDDDVYGLVLLQVQANITELGRLLQIELDFLHSSTNASAESIESQRITQHELISNAERMARYTSDIASYELILREMRAQERGWQLAACLPQEQIQELARSFRDWIVQQQRILGNSHQVSDAGDRSVVFTCTFADNYWVEELAINYFRMRALEIAEDRVFWDAQNRSDRYRLIDVQGALDRLNTLIEGDRDSSPSSNSSSNLRNRDNM